MLPGQTPYTPAELDQVHDLVDAAAANDPGEGNEPSGIIPDDQACESGWTGDRCTFRLFHDGPHSNEVTHAAGFRARLIRRGWPRPTEYAPGAIALEAMSWDGDMEATDGCGPVEDDGYCEHGHPSWMLELGLI